MRRVSSVVPGLQPKWIAAVLLAALADVLLFRDVGRPIGLPVPLFLLGVGLAAAWCNDRDLRRQRLPALLLLAALLPLVETADPLSLFVATTGLAAFALLQARRLSLGTDLPADLLRFFAAAPFALAFDEMRRRRAAKRRSVPGTLAGRAAALAVWIMPVLVASGFVLLLGAGNPILAGWLALLDPLALLNPVRLAFWAGVVVLVWPFLRPRLRWRLLTEAAPAARPAVMPRSPLVAVMTGPASIRRALVLFNLVFAAETVLDAVYLWGGVALPAGLSYANYAHRGAYTLVATALLSAAFVLLALRPGSVLAADRRVRALVILWIGQNIFLVLSAILRLDLYVDVYALTHWRVAAFLWMGLTATGLALIVARIALARSNRWLVGANLVAASALLYAACYVDFAGLIARFNVGHSYEMTGEGVSIDIDYLASLGPAALPALDRLAAKFSVAGPLPTAWDEEQRRRLFEVRHDLEERLDRREAEGWRGWTFRSWRLNRYRAAREAVPAPPSPAPAFS